MTDNSCPKVAKIETNEDMFFKVNSIPENQRKLVLDEINRLLNLHSEHHQEESQ